jgi:dephospho-CoA kinase
MTVKIGVAGFMGSGKSTCARFLARHGGFCIDADAVAKELMNSDKNIQNLLLAAFGPSVVVTGAVQFSELGRIAFASRDSLERLNRIVHPPLLDRLRHLTMKAHAGMCILDAALIGLWKIEHWFDRCVWIDAARDVRLNRLRACRGLDPAELELRMALQEELVPEPDAAPWIRIDNNREITGVEHALDFHLLGRNRDLVTKRDV